MNSNQLTLSDIRKINKAMRLKDDSHLAPIRSQFNATERAIRRLRRKQRQGLVIDTKYCYKAALEYEISDIVNSTPF